MTAEQSTAAIQWYTGRNGAHAGPFSQAEIERQLRVGELKGTDFIWCQGWPEWKQVGSVLKPVEPAATPPATATAATPASSAPSVTVAPSPVAPQLEDREEQSVEDAAEAKIPRNKKIWGVIAASVLLFAAGAGWWALGSGGGSTVKPPKPVELAAKPAKPAKANSAIAKPYTPEEAKAAADFEAVIEKEKVKFAEKQTIALASLHIQYSMWLAEHGRYAEARAQSDLAMPVSLFHVIRNEALRRKAQAIALEAENTPPFEREGLWRACVEAADGAINEGLTATQDNAEVSMLKGGLVVIARGIGNAYTLRGMCRVQVAEEEAGVADLKKAIEHLSVAPEEADAIKRIEAIVQEIESKPK